MSWQSSPGSVGYRDQDGRASFQRSLERAIDTWLCSMTSLQPLTYRLSTHKAIVSRR